MKIIIIIISVLFILLSIGLKKRWNQILKILKETEKERRKRKKGDGKGDEKEKKKRRKRR